MPFADTCLLLQMMPPRSRASAKSVIDIAVQEPSDPSRAPSHFSRAPSHHSERSNGTAKQPDGRPISVQSQESPPPQPLQQQVHEQQPWPMSTAMPHGITLRVDPNGAVSINLVSCVILL